ncbi:MAG: hypothetical protein H0T60_13755 [Acidobacteria bacterium]|nr:hypothetical protein [Acidobacteriota bacterium]
MSNKLLRDTGEALYGQLWQSALSRDLSVSDRTVRRWVAGSDDIPPGVALDLMRICQERTLLLDDLTERLRCISTAPT